MERDWNDVETFTHKHKGKTRNKHPYRCPNCDTMKYDFGLWRRYLRSDFKVCRKCAKDLPLALNKKLWSQKDKKIAIIRLAEELKIDLIKLKK